MEINATKKWFSFPKKQIKKMKDNNSVFVHRDSMDYNIVNYDMLTVSYKSFQSCFSDYVFKNSRLQVLYKKVFLKIMQNLQENTCARIFF